MGKREKDLMDMREKVWSGEAVERFDHPDRRYLMYVTHREIAEVLSFRRKRAHEILADIPINSPDYPKYLGRLTEVYFMQQQYKEGKNMSLVLE